MKNHSFEAITYYITEDAMTKMLSHCIDALPFEACGFLSGKLGFGEEVWKTKNSSSSVHSFQINERDIEDIHETVEKRNHQITGMYHSHPKALAYPSPMDILYAPEDLMAYLIWSLLPPKPILRCYLIQQKAIYEISYKVIKRGD